MMFTHMCVHMQVLLYHGSKEERQEMRQKYGFEKRQKHKATDSFPVLLTSFEVAMNDGKKLQNLDWKYLIVDEGQRLKNKDCRLLRELKALNAGNRLLLSGTPLQNNLTELWSLLHFILPDIFQDLQTFQTWFDFDEQLHADGGSSQIIEDESKHKTISKLHTILDPFLLRRLKTDVLKFLPPKREYIVLAPMTEKQMSYNTAIQSKTLEETIKESNRDYELGEKGWEQFGQVNKAATSMQNVMMQMRKNCNHPYLFQAPTDALGNIVVDERVVEWCGKLKLLDRALKQLYSAGHKTLIFCQMTRMMDILEDYCELRGYAVHRIDGMVPWGERQELMDSFNNGPLDQAFVFLLSTRAGGLGINLVSADTVIIYDGDFNPQQDLQAMDRSDTHIDTHTHPHAHSLSRLSLSFSLSHVHARTHAQTLTLSLWHTLVLAHICRCHRIGQTKPVQVIRLLTTQSIETRIFERATNKRKLELVAIARKRFKVADKVAHGADISDLQLAGSADADETDKESLRTNLMEIRQTLSAEDLNDLLRARPLDEVNSHIISEKDLVKLLLHRDMDGKQKAVETDGRGWQFLASTAGEGA